MAHVVFLRAANVGGTQVFRPAQLTKTLKHLDLVNLGAAGTFVVRAAVSPATIRRELAKHLPFKPVLAICTAREVNALIARDPFRGSALSKDLRGWIGVLTAPLPRQPPLPYVLPETGRWIVRLDEIDGPFAVGLLRRDPVRQLYPGASLEKTLGASMTVRWWETFVKLGRLLDGPRPRGA